MIVDMKKLLRLTCLTSLSLSLALAAASCGDDGSGGDSSMDTSGGGGGEGAPCSTFTDCQSPLDCIMGICTSGTLGGSGDSCIYTRACMDDLYCSAPRTCQSDGSGPVFSECTDSGDCVRPLVCSFEPDGNYRCVADGDGDIGGSCTVLADCVAGLFCIDGQCVGDLGGGCSGPGDCSGGLICVDGMCVSGPDAGDSGRDAFVDVGVACEEVVDCNDMNECTIDQCVSDMCRNTLNDGDEDGYASNLIGSCGLDCNDMDADVSPDHTDFETVRQMDMLPLTPDNFDWNCDGREEQQYTARVPDCDDTGVGTCTMGEGWTGIGMIPRCGTTGTWARCTGPGAGCRIETVETRTQGCR